MSNIKIFVSTRIDKDCKFIENPLYIPVRCGAYFDKNKNSTILGDNTGDNISPKKESFCELTVLYWAWKNQKADYYGLCHYRRYLSFSDATYNTVKNQEHYNGCVLENSLSADNIDKHKLTSIKDIKKALANTDALFATPLDLEEYNCTSNYDAMQKAPLWHNMKDVDTTLEIIKEKYPLMYETAKNYMFNYKYSYLYNSFIMKQEIFNQYCSWLFDILFELERRIDMSNYPSQMYRTPGTIAERLTGIWALWMQKNHKKIKHTPLIFFENTEQNKDITPAFSTNNIAVGVSSSNEYVPYLSVYLQSIKQHVSPQHNYDILVFERNITEENKEILTSQIQQSNISIRFINPINIVKNYDLKFSGNYNLECYFRLSAPLLLKDYKKILFTDADLVFNQDPAKLYKEDIQGYPLAACKDLMWGLMLNMNNPGNWQEYAQKELELEKPYEYFNTGVMLLNIQEFNKNNYSYRILEKVSKKNYRILEQDGLNAFFKTNIKYIDTAWNFPIRHQYFKSNWRFMPKKFEEQYNKDKQNPFIIHYAGSYKPWTHPQEHLAYIWWQYARQTPFYEEILQIRQEKDKEALKLLFIGEHRYSFWFKKIKYKILKNLAGSKKKGKYTQEYDNIKTLLKSAKQLKKDLTKF